MNQNSLKRTEIQHLNFPNEIFEKEEAEEFHNYYDYEPKCYQLISGRLNFSFEVLKFKIYLKTRASF